MARSNISLKAILAVCMAALVALAIAGCGSSSSSSAASGSASASASSEASASASSESDSAEDTADKASGKSSSASSSKSSSASSASASASSSSSVATGQLVDAKNETTGYTFKTDKGYKVKYDGSDTLVYTSATEGAVPWFAFRIMKNATGQSVEEFLTKYGNDAVEEYKDKIVVQPTANTVKIGDRTIKGIEYVRLNDKGDKKIAVLEYVDTNNSGNLLIWNTICYQTDAETPAAMQKAMETFKWLAG